MPRENKGLTVKGKSTIHAASSSSLEKSEGLMSLNQKYTWHDFLRENPEHREKKTKRTSNEGKKAFEAAFKANAKKYLEEQQARYDRQLGKASERSKVLTEKVSALRKAKKFARAKIAQRKAGRADAAIAQIAGQKGRSQAKRKSL